MISSRFAPVLALMVGLALVPTFMHAYLGVRLDDGLRSASIPMHLGGYTGQDTTRDANWGQRRFESFDWIERTYESSDHHLFLTVVRTFDLKSVYHHPELAVAYGTPFVTHEVVRLPSRPEMPVHRLVSDGDRPSVALYVLEHGGRFVDDPIWFQLRTSIEMLARRRKPMTLLFVRDATAPASGDIAGLDATRLLLAAIDAFQKSADAAPSR